MSDQALLNALAACASAETLLATLLQHDPEVTAPVDVATVARRLGIGAIGDLVADRATSGLDVDAARHGTILLAASLSPQQRRFAIAHQLGHFLLSGGGAARQCTNRDLGETRRDTPQRKDEMQANRFAAGLLMPKPHFVACVAGLGKPTIAHLPTLAATYDVTLEAAASRYLELSQAMCALVFIKDGVVRYARASRSFAALAIGPGDTAPTTLPVTTPKDRIVWHAAEVRDWIALARDVRAPKLTLQLLTRANGVQLVLLFANAAAERRADEDAEKDATERRVFGRRPS